MNRKALLRLIRPNGLSLVLTGFALLLFGSGLLISILALFYEGGPDVATGLIFLIFVPITTILLFLAAIVSRRAGPRFALGALALFLAFVEIAGLTILIMRDTNDDLSVLLFTALILCAPVFLIGGLPLFVSLPGLPKEIEAAVFAERLERALDFLRRQERVVHYRELVHLLRASETEVDRILVALLDSEQIQGKRYPKYRIFVTQAALNKIFEQIPGLVELHGQISFDELAQELEVLPELVQEWVTMLIEDERFSGYIHWKEKRLYSQDAEALHELKNCPQCGGELRLAGKGVIHCTHCGHDIFLREPLSSSTAPKQGRKRARKSILADEHPAESA